jgi:tetratricopeptide (TPR) repeat protein
LQVHLKRLENQSSVERWDDTRIEAGSPWRKEIETAMSSAVAAVLLITEDFLASDFICQYELPPLLRAAKKKGTLIIPVIGMPCSYSKHRELSKLQAINPLNRTLSKMTAGDQEELWIKVVSQIERKLDAATRRVKPRARRKTASQRVGTMLVLPGSVPAVGRFLGRAEQIARLRAFCADDFGNVAVVQGFYGVGKTTFVAKLAGLVEAEFDGVFWLPCRSDQASPDILFAAIGAFLVDNGDRSPRQFWGNPDPKCLPLKIQRLLSALQARRYLLVFDGFEEWLDADFALGKGAVRSVLMAILRGAHRSKVVLISRKRPLFDPTTEALPFGDYMEETIAGLKRAEAIELLRLSGLDLDEGFLGRLADEYEGNPQWLRIASFQISGLHRDPEELLQNQDADSRIDQLLVHALSDLSDESREVLDLLSTFRQPLTRGDLQQLGFPLSKAVGPVLNRFLARETSSTHLVVIVGPVRKAIVTAQTSARRRELHARAAAYCAKVASGVGGRPESDHVQFALEEAFHRRELGDFAGAGRAVVAVVGRLIEWGYTDQAEAQLNLVVNKPSDPATLGRALLALGRIADLRGKADSALDRFRRAQMLLEDAADHSGHAEALYRIGGVNNALGNLSEAESFLRKSLSVSKKRGISAALAPAELGLGWNLQQLGKPSGVVLRHYELAIAHAEAASDWPVVSAGNRNLGFVLWDKKREKARSRDAYARAGDIAKKHDLVKELSAVEIDLAYLSTVWGDPMRGEEFARRAIDSCTHLGDQYGLGNAYSNLGQALEAQERWPDAASAYRESRRLSVALRNFGGEVFAERGLARLHRRLGETAEAKSILSTALKRAVKRDHRENAETIRRELAALKRGQDRP